ncbi:hypothetical protein V1515DRAFT_589144 [Lipomyces mesembrius]
MSGFSPKGDFYIARAQIVSPLEPQKRLFPTVDYWLARYNGQTEIDLTIENGEVLETSIAGHGFLRHGVFERSIFSGHSFPKKNVYRFALVASRTVSDPMFLEWERHFWELYRQPDAETVVSTRLQTVIPDVAASISNIHDGMTTKIVAVHEAVTQGMAELRDAVARSQQETRQFCSRISIMESGFNCIFHGGSLDYYGSG